MAYFHQILAILSHFKAHFSAVRLVEAMREAQGGGSQEEWPKMVEQLLRRWAKNSFEAPNACKRKL